MVARLRSWIVWLLLAAAVSAVAVLVAARFIGGGAGIGDLVIPGPAADVHAFPAPGGPEAAAAPVRPAPAVPPATDQPPRNVIVVLGDGVGLGQLSTVSALVLGPAGGLAVESAPVVGLVRTWAGNALVTDSAAAASAMATGMKTPKGAISMQADGSAPCTLFEAAAASGMATGFVTTAGLPDATPAAFLAHAANRDQYRTILEQMLASDATVLIGGDWQLAGHALRQRDYLELVREAESAAGTRFTVVRDASALATTPAPLIALLPARPGNRRTHGPPLADSARRALDLLDDHGSGFLLIIEQEETDEAAHDNDVNGVVAAMVELDEAIRAMLAYAAARGDTLVLVTSDHDTAGMAATHGGFDDGMAEVGWLDDGHLATWVPLFAFGPGAGQFAGVLDNTEIGRRIADLCGLEGLPPPS